MTAQIPDLFKYKNKNFDIVGVEGGNLASADDFDMKPVMINTGCYRGYSSKYSLKENILILDEFKINAKELKPINNIMPENPEKFPFVYKNLNLNMDFTGKLTLGDEFIQEEYVHMGFQSPSSYNKVIELEFKNGLLVNTKDKSQEYAEKRGNFTDKYLNNPFGNIDEAFSLNKDK